MAKSLRDVNVSAATSGEGLTSAAAGFSVRALYLDGQDGSITPLIGKAPPEDIASAIAEMRRHSAQTKTMKRVGDAILVRTKLEDGDALIWLSQGPLTSGHEQIESFSRVSDLISQRGGADPVRLQAAQSIAETAEVKPRRWLKQVASALSSHTGWGQVALLELSGGRLRRVHASSRELADRFADLSAFVSDLGEDRVLHATQAADNAAAQVYTETHRIEDFTLYAPVDGFGLYVEAQAKPDDLTFAAELIEQRRKPVGARSSWLRRGILAALALAVIIYGALPAPIQIGAPAELRPAVSELQVSLHQARLLEVRVQVGEQVQPGDVLAVLSSPQLETEEEKASLDIALEDLNGQQALGDDDFAAFELSEKRSEILKLRADQSRRRLAELEVRASVAGRIADLVDRREIGAVLNVGSIIAEIQKSPEMNAVLTLDPNDGPLLSKGMSGEILLRGVVEQSYSLTLIEEPVLMSASDGSQSLTVLAALDGEADDALYKGLSGFAQIDGSTGPRALNYLRPLIEFLELKIWQFTGWRF